MLSSLSLDDLTDFLESLDPDAATDAIQLFPKRKQENIVERLSERLRESVTFLLGFDPDTAAGLMSVNYVQVSADDTIAAIAKRFQEHEKRTGREPSILVLAGEKILGYVPAHQLAFAKPTDKASAHVRRIRSVHHKEKPHDVADVIRKSPHNKVVVLGDRNQILGIIYSDDVLRILHESATTSLYQFAGVSSEEVVGDSFLRKVNFRYKWLIINLGTAFFASSVVNLFDVTISKYVFLAVYMPIVSGMGGNAATQTLAVVVRGISLKQISLNNCWHTLRNELGSGLINGSIDGSIAAGIVYILTRDPLIAFILGFAMVINLLVAAFFGTLVPLIMKRLGKDPASSATIFITTATDVLGFLAFLGMASVLLA